MVSQLFGVLNFEIHGAALEATSPMHSESMNESDRFIKTESGRLSDYFIDRF